MEVDSVENVERLPICRVCNEEGLFSLSEMKFRCNEDDVLLIDAFNSFSSLENVSQKKIRLRKLIILFGFNFF